MPTNIFRNNRSENIFSDKPLFHSYRSFLVILCLFIPPSCLPASPSCSGLFLSVIIGLFFFVSCLGLLFFVSCSGLFFFMSLPGLLFFLSCSGLIRTSIASPVKLGNDREKKSAREWQEAGSTGMTEGGKSGNDRRKNMSKDDKGKRKVGKWQIKNCHCRA